MTDFTDDELVSAVIDGEATQAEEARVEADPALSARLVELRAARDAIGASVTLPSRAERDAAIATAVDLRAPVDVRAPIDVRALRRRRALRVASIAAAVLIVVGILGGIAALSGRHIRGASSTAAGQASSSSSTASPGGTADNSLSPDASKAGAGTPTAGVVAELGPFQTQQALVDAVRQSQAVGATRAQQQDQLNTAAAVPDSSAANRTCESRPDAQLVAHAQLAGQPVIVIVTGGHGQQTLEVDDVNCAVLFTQPL